MKNALRESKIHPIDLHVGLQIKNRRNLIGASQNDLGTALGVTYQQVQKYEAGVNRIAISRAYEIGLVLKVDPGYFFKDVTPSTDTFLKSMISNRQNHQKTKIGVTKALERQAALVEREAAKVAAAYISLKSDAAREQVKGFFALIGAF